MQSIEISFNAFCDLGGCFLPLLSFLQDSRLQLSNLLASLCHACLHFPSVFFFHTLELFHHRQDPLVRLLSKLFFFCLNVLHAFGWYLSLCFNALA